MIAPIVRGASIETSRGPVEFVVAGSGPAVLYFHGTPCRNQLAVEMERPLIAARFQLIVPQRPGYYGTPLAGRRTTADCADLATLVLDHLGVDRVAVMGTSGGGPSALAFAIRFPARTAALVLQCAQVHRWDARQWAPTSRPWLYHCFRRRLPRWLFCRCFPLLFRVRFPGPDHYLQDLAGPRYPELLEDRAFQQFIAMLQGGICDFRHERPGYYNDVSTWVREDVLSTGRVACPTLLLHDPEDPAVPFCHAQYAASQIDGAELLKLHVGGHWIWYGRDAGRMCERRAAFLRQHLGDATA